MVKHIPTKEINNKNTINTTITQQIDSVNKERSKVVNKKIQIKNKKYIELLSYLSNTLKTIYLKKKINNGSFNDIYNFSLKKEDRSENKFIIRISNENSTVDSINSELKGIKIQYELCLKSKHIGNVIDYGKIYNPNSNTLQEYSIHQRYKQSLKDVLNSDPKYYSINTVVQLIFNLIATIYIIHKNNIAHLDLKPDNILINNIEYKEGKIYRIDFVIIDFGAAKKFSGNNSKSLSAQMASAQFSPPELLQYKFGKKSDIWAIGVLIYLIFVGKNFFSANAQDIFMNNNTIKLEKNINNAITKLLYSLKNQYTISSSLYTKLKKILNGIFKVNPNERFTAKELYEIIY